MEESQGGKGMAVNVANAYVNTTIQTASKAELTLMLYDGAVKFCNIALLAIEKKDIEKAHENIIKAQRIIVELRSTLNMKYPVAKEFDQIYEIIYDQLLEANIRKDTDVLTVALDFIREMRDTWKQVMELNRGK